LWLEKLQEDNENFSNTGVKMPTKSKIKKFKQEGQYPHKTKNWLRYRQEEPSKF